MNYKHFFQKTMRRNVKIDIVYMKYPSFGFGEPRIGVRSSWLKFELLFRCLVCAVVRIRLLKTGKSTLGTTIGS